MEKITNLRKGRLNGFFKHKGRRILALALAIVLAIGMVPDMAIVVKAGAPSEFDPVVNSVTFYDDGSVKSITASTNWIWSGGEDYWVALLLGEGIATEHSGDTYAGWYRGKNRFHTLEDSLNAANVTNIANTDFIGPVANTSSHELSRTLTLPQGMIKPGQNKEYYLYIWTHDDHTNTGKGIGYYPDCVVANIQTTIDSIYIKRRDNGAELFSWTGNTVTLDKQNGTGGSDSAVAKNGSAMPTISVPTRSGYVFGGYYDNTSNGTQYYTASGTSAKNWDKSSNTTLYARWIPNKYTIKFVNDDNTVISSEQYDYGTTAANITKPNDPTKEKTAQYTYTFAGWTPELKNVTEDKTYTATYSQVVNKYTVTWKNDDGTILETDTDVEYGATPNYDGETPTKEATAQYTYTFSDWDKEISAVTGNVTYTAQFDREVNKYTVTWTNYDDSVLKEESVDYGVVPEYTGATPTKPADAQYTYSFLGWTPEIDAVTGNITYKATYTNAINSYMVKWLNYDNTVLQEGTVDYGVTPEYTGTTPTKPADEQYTYTFLSWTPVVIPVVDNVVYIATYTQTEIKKDDGEKAVSTEVKKDEKSPDVKAANLTDEFAESTLSNEEKTAIEEAINNGEDVDVDVYLEIEDISGAISASDKEKINASATNADNIAFFDISLFKEISISGRSRGATSIHELATPLKLIIGVPKSFPDVADGYTRTYEVIRLHNGNVEKLPTTLNADGTITFETDKFSTYALAYTDTKKEEATTKVDSPNADVPKAENTNKDNKVSTGDKINIGVIVMLMMDSAMAALYLTLRRRLMK